jgi:uncharacterized protein (DUF1778 family)
LKVARERITVRLPADLARWLRRTAEADGVSLSQVVVDAVRAYRHLGDARDHARDAAVIAAQVACRRFAKEGQNPAELLDAVLQVFRKEGESDA